MRLVSLEVKGLKSLRDTKIEGLDHYNVLTGRNNAGKSAILEALRLLSPLEPELDVDRAREIMTGIPQAGRMRMSATFILSDLELDLLPGAEVLRGRTVLGRVNHWRYDMEMRVGHEHWPEPQLYVTACGPTIKDDYAPLFRLPHPDNPSQREVLSPPDFERVLKLDARRIGSQVAALQAGAWRTISETPVKARNPGPAGQLYFRLLGEFVTRLRFLDSGRSAADASPLVETRTLAARGGNITAVVETLLSGGGSQFGVLERRIKSLFPDVAGVRAPTEGDHKVLRIAMKEEQGSSGHYRLSEVGMGVQQALMVATAVVSTDPGSVILIEEPENNLHPGAQRALVEFLQSVAIDQEKQILLTTHSTIFTSTADGCSTYLVRLDDAKCTKVRKLDRGRLLAVKHELGLRNVDLYGFEMVVLWEGESELQAMKVLMPIMLDRLAREAESSADRLGVTFRSLGGSDKPKMEAVREFLRLLDDLDIMPYLVLDDDEGVREHLDSLVKDGLLGSGEYYIWHEGRSRFGRKAEVRCEFEDCFSNDQLVNASLAVARDAGRELGLEVDEFTRRCSTSPEKTSRVLGEYYREQANYRLSKTDLACKLADLVAPELRGDKERTVDEYEFEKVGRQIFTKVGGMT